MAATRQRTFRKALSRAQRIEDFAIACDGEITRELLLNIGKGAAYNKRRDFEQRKRDRAATMQQQIIDLFTALDPNTQLPTVDGGFNALVAQFRADISPDVLAQIA